MYRPVPTFQRRVVEKLAFYYYFRFLYVFCADGDRIEVPKLPSFTSRIVSFFGIWLAEIETLRHFFKDYTSSSVNVEEEEVSLESLSWAKLSFENSCLWLCTSSIRNSFWRSLTRRSERMAATRIWKKPFSFPSLRLTIRFFSLHLPNHVGQTLMKMSLHRLRLQRKLKISRFHYERIF